MKIMITGGLGHIGSALIQRLAPPPGVWPDVIHSDTYVFNELERHVSGITKVTVLDNFRTQRHPVLFRLPKGVKFIEADILDEDLERHFDDYDVVVHLAAITDAANSHTIKDEVYKVNIEGTEQVAKACEKVGCCLIFPSTTSVYGEATDIVDEESKVRPQSPYAESKLIGEQCLYASNIDYVIFRFGTIFGPSLGMRFHTAVNQFIWNAVQDKPIEVWKGVRSQGRPYLDLLDACRVIEFAINECLFDRQIYNVSTFNLTVDQVIAQINDVVPGADDLVELVDHQLLNQLSYSTSTKKIEQKGFKFQGNLRHGIVGTVRLLHAMGGERE